MKTMLITACGIGALVFWVSELSYQAGKARMLGVCLKGGLIDDGYLKGMTVGKIWPNLFVYYIAKHYAKDKKGERHV